MQTRNLSTFARCALGTLLWSETDCNEDDSGEPFVSGHFRCGCDVPAEDFDFDPDGLAQFSRECESFLEDLEESGHYGVQGLHSHAGDFILSRNGHGTGYWDRGFPETTGRTLHKLAKCYGTVSLYRNDDDSLSFGG